MGKAERILDLFPSFYRTADRTKLLATVVRRLVQPLEEVDTHLFRIQRAHRLRVAEHVKDIARLAGTLNLSEAHFDDIVSDDALSYDQKLALMRDRVQRVAQVHLEGLGTPWAILESTAIFLRANIVPQEPGLTQITHMDPEGYSHRATLEFSYLPDKPRAQVVLHENPLRRKKVQLAERWQMDLWKVENQGADPADTRFVITGVEDHTVLPSVFCPQTNEGVLFYGAVPEGRTLVIDQAMGATLDGEPVNEWLISFKGGIAEFGVYGGASYVQEEGQPALPFDGDLERSAARLFQRRTSTPTVPTGSSEWHFKVADGVYDGSLYDFSVYETAGLPIGIYDQDFNYDSAVYDFRGTGIVGMSWDERASCAFKLVLPSHLLQAKSDNQSAPMASDKRPTASSGGDHVSRIASILPRFKPAGVRAYVDLAKDGWILGQSVLRTIETKEGEGIEFHTTRALNPNADLLLVDA